MYIAGDKGEYTGAVFVDFRKAFDTVPHKILIHKLKCIGISGTVLKWFESYLRDRTIQVKMNNVISEPKKINVGVPQGGNISPLLFTIFVNDIPQIFSKSKCLLYADDLIIYHSDRSISKVNAVLNDEMKLLEQWVKNHGMKINIDKTKTMLFRPTHKSSPQEKLIVFIDTQIVEQVINFKYLGILLDEKLLWHDHCNSVCKNVSY